MTYKEFVERLAAILTVSDVRQGEDALRKSQARLRAIFESATDAILTTDETQTIVTVNPAAAEIFRCAREDMVGSPLERFIPERFRTRHRHDMQKLGEAVVSSRPSHVTRANHSLAKLWLARVTWEGRVT